MAACVTSDHMTEALLSDLAVVLVVEAGAGLQQQRALQEGLGEGGDDLIDVPVMSETQQKKSTKTCIQLKMLQTTQIQALLKGFCRKNKAIFNF